VASLLSRESCGFKMPAFRGGRPWDSSGLPKPDRQKCVPSGKLCGCINWTRSERPANAGRVGMGPTLRLLCSPGNLAALKCLPFGAGGCGVPQDRCVARGALLSRPIPFASVTEFPAITLPRFPARSRVLGLGVARECSRQAGIWSRAASIKLNPNAPLQRRRAAGRG
jgi:hypothetical protein